MWREGEGLYYVPVVVFIKATQVWTPPLTAKDGLPQHVQRWNFLESNLDTSCKVFSAYFLLKPLPQLIGILRLVTTDYSISHREVPV